MSGVGVTIRARAARDLAQHADWLRAEAGVDVAERFLANAARSFETLAASPGLGARVEARAPELAEAHKWRVADFPNWLIFYLPQAKGGVAIIRILHAAQNWTAR